MAYELSMRRKREVRDIYSRLRKKYRQDVIVEWIERNYFLDKTRFYYYMSQCDDKPVDNPSILYTIVMRDDFHL
jgi:hypothetical protein